MKTLRIAAACAAVLVAGYASAQEDKSATTATPPVAQDVGGTSQLSATGSGSSMRITRQQVNDDMARSQSTGELNRLQQDIYHGH
jgi:hypothetical protein